MWCTLRQSPPLSLYCLASIEATIASTTRHQMLGQARPWPSPARIHWEKCVQCTQHPRCLHFIVYGVHPRIVHSTVYSVHTTQHPRCVYSSFYSVANILDLYTVQCSVHCTVHNIPDVFTLQCTELYSVHNIPDVYTLRSPCTECSVYTTCQMCTLYSVQNVHNM